MGINSGTNNHLGLSRLKLFFALSRTPHGLLDMATPCLSALLWLGDFPALRTILLGLITTFAGYTAVYALNDVVDFRSDRKKLQKSRFRDSDNYLDGVLVRHPLADGLINLKEGILWVIAWAFVAVIGAYQLNPECVIIFFTGCSLEIIYCLLLKITYLRALVSGIVKTTGAIAAIFAVDPNPSFLPLSILFLWLFFWEIGGQNVPADLTDIEEDRRFQAKTIPVRFGPLWACVIILATIMLAVLLNVILFVLVQGVFSSASLVASFLLGIYLLVLPALRLYKTKDRLHAIELFNKASFYPAALLLIITIKLIITV